MSTMMHDILNERLDAQTANAVCNVGGKMLKSVEMQYRYGSKAQPADLTLRIAP